MSGSCAISIRRRWKLLDPKSLELLNRELADIYSKGGTAWLETTAIAQLASTVEGARWLETYARNETLKELRDAPVKFASFKSSHGKARPWTGLARFFRIILSILKHPVNPV